AQLELPRNAAGEIHEFDVEKRRARFEGIQHARAIHFREDAILQIEVRPKLQRTINDVRLAASIPGFDRLAVNLLRVGWLAEEFVNLARFESAHPNRVPEFRRV